MGYVVFTTKDSFDINITETVKRIIERDTEIVELIISDFYKEKRMELIEKICKINSRLCKQDVDNISTIIDHLVQRKHGLFNLSPDFIIQYVKYFIGIDQQERKGEAVFNVIFETNIRNAIINNAYKNDVGDFIISLEEIAYYMHFHKVEQISSDEIQKIINEYNLKYTLNINAKRFVESITKAKILQECSDSLSYEFCNRNYLAYFVANKINKLIERNGIAIDELKHILRNICFGINDTILLFLSYLRNNTKFALSLCTNAEEILSDYEEIDFDKSNISFLKRQSKDKIKLPSLGERKAYYHRTNDLEKKRREQETEEIKYKGLYDYDDNDAEKFQYKIGRAVKYLELISKSLISQFSILEAGEKQQIIESMYKLPNKILFAALKPYEDNYDRTIDQLKEVVDSMKSENKLSVDELERIFINCAISICLGLFDNVAFCGANNKTLLVLNSFNLSNSNYTIINLIMEENGGTTDSFIEKAIKLADGSDDEFLIYLIKLVARKHIITHDSIKYNQLDKLSTSIFKNCCKKQLLLMSLNSSAKKE